MKRFQINEVEFEWGGFLVDADAEAASRFLPGVSPTNPRNDLSIVREAWDTSRTIVTCNRRDFLRYIQQFQNRDNGRDCRDLWGLVVVPNLDLQRDKGLKLIKRGLAGPRWEPLRRPGAAFLNLYVRVSADHRPDIWRFKRCQYCERSYPIPEPWIARG